MPFANMQQFAVSVYSNGYDMNHIEITGTIILGTGNRLKTTNISGI
jgi:hypothetical protein